MAERQMNDARWAELVQQAMSHRDEVAEQQYRMALGLLAGERVTFFGRAVEITISWPEGPPLDMSDAELRAWAAAELAKRTALDHSAGGGERSDTPNAVTERSDGPVTGR